MAPKFLDQKGVELLWSKIRMEDYPNNETLMAVIEAIDETKITAPSSAEIGQILAVKHINENGVPIEWECVDNSQGTNNNIELDTTLTQSGKAADAKAVGDALHEHSNKEFLDQITSIVNIYTDATEPANAADGSIWINLNSDSDAPTIYVRRNGVWEMSSDGKPQTQADWDERDSLALSYIRNKPFGYKDDLYSNSALPFSLYKNSIYAGKMNNGDTLGDMFTTGDEITVIWDSVTYNLIAKEVYVQLNNSSFTITNILGNGRLVTDALGSTVSANDTGEPFAILPAMGHFYTRSSLASHSVAIKDKNNVIKLDPKFLPDEALNPAVQSDWNETDENSYAFIKNKPIIPSIEGLATEEYVNNAVAQKTLVQIITWEADD